MSGELRVFLPASGHNLYVAYWYPEQMQDEDEKPDVLVEPVIGWEWLPDEESMPVPLTPVGAVPRGVCPRWVHEDRDVAYKLCAQNINTAWEHHQQEQL